MPRLAVANDAHLVQLVRNTLGRDPGVRGLPRPNASSCKLIVSLHGSVSGNDEARLFEEAVRSVMGVRGVENKLVVADKAPKTA